MKRRHARAALGVGAILLASVLSGCAAPGTWFQPSKPTISISSSKTCPRALGPARDVPDHSGGSKGLLPTSGEPSTVLVCTYENRTLTGQSKLGPDEARALASAINNVDLAAPQNGRHNCPAASDSVTLFAFRFGRRDDIDMWWNDSGCQTIDNGRLGASGVTNEFQSVYARLVASATTPSS